MQAEITYHRKRMLELLDATVQKAIVSNEDGEIYCGLILHTKSGKQVQLVALRDPEGNGPGHFDIQEIP